MKLIFIALLLILSVSFAIDLKKKNEDERCFCTVDDCSTTCTIEGNSANCDEPQNCDKKAPETPETPATETKTTETTPTKKDDDDHDHHNHHGDHDDNHHGDHDNNHHGDHDNHHGDHDNNHHGDHDNNHHGDHDNNHHGDHDDNHHGDHDNGNDDDWRDGNHDHHINDHNNHQHHNLIRNGGFEYGFFGWRRFSLNQANSWEIQRGRNFYSAHNLPRPPQGRNAAMIASPTGAAKVFLYQDVDIRRFRNCGLIKFDLKYRYFYDNDGTGFNTAFWSPNAQFFSVDILSKLGVPLDNVFVTRTHSPQTTNNRYHHQNEQFFYTNAINSFHNDELRVQFSENAKNRLRVGIDDVILTARCVEFRDRDDKTESTPVKTEESSPAKEAVPNPEPVKNEVKNVVPIKK